MLESNLSTTSKKLVFAQELSLYGPEQAETVSLQQSLAYCRRWSKCHSENFIVASLLLPRSLRQDFRNIYAYCRWSDDLADEIDDPRQSLRLLAWWHGELTKCTSGQPRHPILVALQQTIRRHRLDIEPFADLLSAFRQDQSVRRYADDDQLLDYCCRSANPVGRILLQLARVSNGTTLPLSDAVCTGLQLANFCQDISRDAQQGRIYFPRSRWQTDGVDEAMLLNRQVTPELQLALTKWVRTAQQHLLQGWPLIEFVPPWLRTDVDLFVRGGLAILQAIETQKFDVWTERPQLSKWTQARLLATSLLTSRFRHRRSHKFAAIAWEASDKLNPKLLDRTDRSIGSRELRACNNVSTPVLMLSPRVDTASGVKLTSLETQIVSHRETRSSTLLASHHWCALVCRQSKSSFRSSFALLDGKRRQAMCALYAFARIADDLADNNHPPAGRAEQLQQLRNELWHHCAPESARVIAPHFSSQAKGSTSGSSLLWPALASCVNDYKIPVQLLDDIIAGVSLDVQHRQPENWDELERYCYHVASAVGLACTHIWLDNGRSSEFPTRAATACGLAFQLTNILRDIGEDAKAGRIYLPQSLFVKYQVDPQAWLDLKPTGDWQAMIDEVAQRARSLYISGWPTIFALTPRSGRMFSLIWHSYRDLLSPIVVHKERLWSQPKIRLSRLHRLRLLATHSAGWINSNRLVPSDRQLQNENG